MNWTLAKAVEVFDDVETRRLTREDMDKNPIPIYDIVIGIKKKGAVEYLVRKYSKSKAWIIPYNLAAVVTHNAATFSTSLLTALLVDLPDAVGPDILNGYLSNLQAHVRKNQPGIKKNATAIRKFLMTTALYSAHGDTLVHFSLYEVLEELQRTNLLREIFPSPEVVDLRNALARHKCDSDDYMLEERNRLLTIIDRGLPEFRPLES